MEKIFEATVHWEVSKVKNKITKVIKVFYSNIDLRVVLPPCKLINEFSYKIMSAT